MKTAQDLVTELIRSGMSEADIAREVGCGQPTIHRMKHGSDTSYSKGKALESLYQEKFGNPPQAA